MAPTSAIVARLTPPRRRGLGYALFFLPEGFVGALAPIAAAFIAEAFGLTSIFYAGIFAFLLGMLVFILGVKV